MPKATTRRKKSTRTLEREARAKLVELRHQLILAEASAAIAHGIARRQLCAIARDLAPNAAALARRGKPRVLAVLAVLAKIISDPRIAPAPPKKSR